jgi:hypothetical protein
VILSKRRLDSTDWVAREQAWNLAGVGVTGAEEECMMEPLDKIRRLIEQGEHQKAKRVLVSYVRRHPDSIVAWRLLAGLVSDPVEQADCWRRILNLDPANVQATIALQRLTEMSDQPGVALRCPQCGGKLVVRLVGEMRDKRATCWHCGTESDLPDADRRVEHQHEQERGDPGVFALARKALTDWLASNHTVMSHPVTSQQDENHRLLSPAEMIQAAGGPLPPEKRRKCPECGTTVPKQAPRCGWCGTSLPA